jgi:hypothetical protein
MQSIPGADAAAAGAAATAAVDAVTAAAAGSTLTLLGALDGTGAGASATTGEPATAGVVIVCDSQAQVRPLQTPPLHKTHLPILRRIRR